MIKGCSLLLKIQAHLFDSAEIGVFVVPSRASATVRFMVMA